MQFLCFISMYMLYVLSPSQPTKSDETPMETTTATETTPTPSTGLTPEKATAEGTAVVATPEKPEGTPEKPEQTPEKSEATPNQTEAAEEDDDDDDDDDSDDDVQITIGDIKTQSSTTYE